MKPVNLLPPKHRPHAPSGDREGGSYIVIAVLGALVLAVLLYVLVSNQVSDRKAELARVKAETASARASAGPLAAFGDFARIKQTRLASVRALATVRFDWERLVRETALVLPSGVYLTNMSASSGGQASGGSSGSSGGQGGNPAGGPEAELTGCARSHAQVAVTMVRLRQLHLANDVELTSSQSTSSGGSSAAAGSGSASGGDCGKGVQFSAKVEFDPETGRDAGEPVPASLGGGS